LIGYYVHLITDAAYQKMVRDEDRVKNIWRRIDADPELSQRAKGLPRDFDTVKKLIPKKERQWLIANIEEEYLEEHSNSGYLTEILPLTEFTDYIDYLPHGCIAHKV